MMLKVRELEVSVVGREAKIGWNSMTSVAGVASGEQGVQEWVWFVGAALLGLGTVQLGFWVGCHWHRRVWDAGFSEGCV